MTIWGAEDQTQVGHIQGKYLPAVPAPMPIIILFNQFSKRGNDHYGPDYRVNKTAQELQAVAKMEEESKAENLQGYGHHWSVMGAVKTLGELGTVGLQISFYKYEFL